MYTNEETYHESINMERLYWKHLFYKATEGGEYADRMIDIDKEIQLQHKRKL